MVKRTFVFRLRISLFCIPLNNERRYSEGMSENIVEERTCRYPGCQRPAMASEGGTGRPPEYCDDPSHNRAAAWRARQRLTDTVHAAETRPVDAARQRASEITGQVTGMIEHLGQQLTALVDELRTVGDPEATEAQIESVASEAAEQVAGANARATRAEQAQRRAEAERDEADAAAEEATRKSEELAENLAVLQAELDATRQSREQLASELSQVQAAAVADREQAQAEAAELRADIESARAQLRQLQQDHDAVVKRAEVEEQARAEAERRAGAAESRAQAEAERADRGDATIEEIQGQLATARADLDRAREVAADLRGNLATLTAEREAARANVEVERAHGEQRVKDLHDTYGRQIDQLRHELAQARETPEERRTSRPRTAGEGQDATP
jgi:colicin import membrane protein